jgi:hypothetical protein
MSCTPPAALSVYRGQSRSGIGEGLGRPVSHGEQYLAAAPELLASEPLLDAVRPWMTLGSDPADHERLSDGLEGWSVLRLHGFDLVARLVSAGRYERRAAFFAHGRLWPSEPGCPGFDPGLHVGRSEMFERPFRDDDPGERVPEAAPALVRPDQVAAEPGVAALLLAHLLEGCVRGRPLIVAAPIADFAAGTALHALVSFARGALPADLKVDCRVRIYTRKPELFLGHLAANMVVLPEDSFERALTARPDATVLGRQGKRLAGEAPDAQALAYAQAVAERAIRIPGGLALFSERYRDRRSRRGLPVAADVCALPVSYNLAVALAGSAETSGDLLRSYLPDAAAKLGTQVDWGRLLTPEEWRRFPAEALEDFLLLDPQALAPGARALQEAAERVVGQAAPIDSRLLSWWDPNDPGKRRRLLALAAARAEAWELLQHAVEERRFSADWARAYLEQASEPQLIEAARRLFAAPGFLRGGGPWQDVSRQLLDALRGLATPPRQLAPVVRQAGETLAPADDLALYLRLTDLAAALGSEDRLVVRLLESLADLDEPESRALLVEAALDPRRRWLKPGALVGNGELRPPGLVEHADRLAGEDEILAALHPAALLRLGAHLTSDRNRARLLGELDERMARDPEATTDVLVRAGWWLTWRRGSRLGAVQLDRAAREWLAAAAWSDDEIVPPREDWNAVLADLPLQLSGPEMKRLRAEAGPRRLPWPWIAPFEEDQLAALVGKAADLGSLAELAEALAGDERFQETGLPSAASYVLARSRFAGRLPPDALGWLQAKPPRMPLPLRLQESSDLWRAAGHRQTEALAARISSVAAALAAGDVEQALEAAEEPYLWREPAFLAELAGWLCSRGSLEGLDGHLVEWIDQHVDGAPARHPERPPPGLIQELVHRERPFTHVARLLSPGLLDEATRMALLAAACRALAQGREDDGCWPALATEVARHLAANGGGPSPLSALADQVRLGQAAERRGFRDHGWKTFMAVVRRHAGLLGYRARQGAALPVFDLAASLYGPGATGQAALQVLWLRGSEGEATRREAWAALVRGLGNRPRGQGHDGPDERDDVALALVLAATEELDEGDRQILWRALQDERLVAADWCPPADCGGKREMSGPVTFFRPRGDDVGATHDFVLDAGEETRRLYLAARKPLDPAAVSSRKLPIGEIAAATSRMVGEIAGQGEGGALVVLLDRQGRRSAAVRAAQAVEDDAFRTFVLLAPGAPPSVQAADAKWFDLPQGAHLLVPVDRRAEERLVRFQEDLDWLPPDLAALVLYALRRPSLDAFVRRLDGKAAEQAGPADDAAGGLDSFWKKLRRSTLLWPLLAAVLFLLLGANLWLLWSLRSRIDALTPPGSKGAAAAVAPAESRNADGGSHPDRNASPAAANPTASAEIAGLLQDVEAFRKSRAAFEALAAGPFNGLAGAGENGIARLLASGRGARPQVLGLIKLEALRLGIAPDAGPFFRAPDNQSEIKAAYLSAGPGALAADADGRALLAALACVAFPRDGTPSLPKTRTPAFNFAPGSTCADFPLGKALPGLAALRAYVQNAGQAGDAARGAS